MFSLTGEYALRALIYMAQHVDDWPIPGRVIAQEASIPQKYLAAVLGQLVREGVLESSRGAGGGFRMASMPKEVRLSDVLTPFEPMLANRRPCPFGNEVCSDDEPCAGHDKWKKVRETYSNFLAETSILDITGNGGRRARPKPARRKR